MDPSCSRRSCNLLRSCSVSALAARRTSTAAAAAEGVVASAGVWDGLKGAGRYGRVEQERTAGLSCFDSIGLVSAS